MGKPGVALLPSRTTLSEFGSRRWRNGSSNPFTSTRCFLLALIVLVCTVGLTSRVLWFYTFMVSGNNAAEYDGKPRGTHNLQREVLGYLELENRLWAVTENQTTDVTLPRARVDHVEEKDEEKEDEEKEDEKEDEKESAKGEEDLKQAKVASSGDAIAFLEQLAGNLTREGDGKGDDDDDDDSNGPYHSRRIFLSDYAEMKSEIRVFVYPVERTDPFYNIFQVRATTPGGNYASEEYFKQALLRSPFVTKDAAEAHLFYMPVSITKARMDRRVGVEGLQNFCRQYVTDVRAHWGYWNRSSGADHFYLSCHSIARSAMDFVPYVRHNAIQLLCPASYFLPSYVSHKDASVPQIWPRSGSTPKLAGHISQRKRLAFFAGALNSNVRIQLAKAWGNDEHILVHRGRVPFPYSEGMLTSKFCLHAKGFEVNTARLGDAMFYGCVPVVIANHYDLPFNDVLDWSKFSIILSSFDIPLLKETLAAVTPAQYAKLHKHVMEARVHFQWHTPPQEFDAFHTVMYELWARRHVMRHTLQ